mgnify:CR=1 FL=1
MRRSDRDCCSGLTAEISCCHLRLTLVWPPLLRWSDSHDAVGLTTGISPVGPSNPSKHKLKISQNRLRLYYFSLCLQSATTSILMKISTKIETLTILSTQLSLKRYREATPSLSIYIRGRQPKAMNQTCTVSPIAMNQTCTGNPNSLGNLPVQKTNFRNSYCTKFGLVPNSIPHPIHTQYLHRMPYEIFTNHVHWSLA